MRHRYVGVLAFVSDALHVGLTFPVASFAVSHAGESAPYVRRLLDHPNPKNRSARFALVSLRTCVGHSKAGSRTFEQQVLNLTSRLLGCP